MEEFFLWLTQNIRTQPFYDNFPGVPELAEMAVVPPKYSNLQRLP